MNAEPQTLVEKQTQQLSRSERGRHCLKGLEVFLDKHCFTLDSENQRAVLGLMTEFLRGSAFTVLDNIREQLGRE